MLELQRALEWATTLSTVPKVLLSLVVVGLGLFVLVILWWPQTHRIPQSSSDSATSQPVGSEHLSQGESNETQQPESSDASPLSPSQSVEVNESTDVNVYQAGGDIVISGSTASPPATMLIQSILVEVRVTCTVRAGAELPPDEVPFLPIGDSHAYLEGAAGRVRLSFQSPVRFRRLDNERLVITNRFSLDPGSELVQRGVETLANYSTLSVPVVTVVWGSSLEMMRLLEVSFFINNQGPLYASWEYDVAFRQGPRFSVPFRPFVDRLNQSE